MKHRKTDYLKLKQELYQQLAQAEDDIKLGKVQSLDSVFYDIRNELKDLRL